MRAGVAVLGLMLGLPIPALAAPPSSLIPDLVPLPPMGDSHIAMARTEVTFTQWDACVAAGGCPDATGEGGWGRGRYPVINVSWNDANAYARWLSAATGRFCRLPTSAEWTFAAQAGTTNPYWWGGVMEPGMARCRGCNPGQPDDGPAPVASYPPNPYGLYDMNGNVGEWALDCAARRAGGGECVARATHGGAWTYFAAKAQGGAESPRPPGERSFSIGFRVVCEP